MLTPNVNLNNATVLVTGAAGFIGSNLVMELLNTAENVKIVGLDNVNDYYVVAIKEYRLQQIEKLAATKAGSQWTFIRGSIADKALIEETFTKCREVRLEDCKKSLIRELVRAIMALIAPMI